MNNLYVVGLALIVFAAISFMIYAFYELWFTPNHVPLVIKILLSMLGLGVILICPLFKKR